MNTNLRLDVNVLDAKNIIKWLRNKDVTKFLNEDKNSAAVLEYLIETGQADLLTYHLNKNSRFFLIDTPKEDCVGFITLFTISPMQEYEVVIAIGNPKNWGKKIGYSALKSILHKVFFGWRINKLVAKIHIENERSINLFKHLSFKNNGVKNSHVIFSITFDEYLNSLK